MQSWHGIWRQRVIATIVCLMVAASARAGRPVTLFPQVRWVHQKTRLGVHLRPMRFPAAQQPRRVSRRTSRLVVPMIPETRYQRQRRRRLLAPLALPDDIEQFTKQHVTDLNRVHQTPDFDDDLVLARQWVKAILAGNHGARYRHYVLIRAFALAQQSRRGLDLAVGIHDELVGELPRGTIAGWLARAEMADSLYGLNAKSRGRGGHLRRWAALSARAKIGLAGRLGMVGHLDEARANLQAAERHLRRAADPMIAREHQATVALVERNLATRDRLIALHRAYDQHKTPAGAQALAVYYLVRLENLPAAVPYMAQSGQPHLLAAAKAQGAAGLAGQHELAKALHGFVGGVTDPETRLGCCDAAIHAYEQFIAGADPADPDVGKAVAAIHALYRQDAGGADLDELPRVEVVRRFPAQRINQIAELIQRGLRCRECDGRGTVTDKKRTGYRQLGGGFRKPVYTTVRVTCPRCDGTGANNHLGVVRNLWAGKVDDLCQVRPDDPEYPANMARLGELLRGYLTRQRTPLTALQAISATSLKQFARPFSGRRRVAVVFGATFWRNVRLADGRRAMLVLASGGHQAILSSVDYSDPDADGELLIGGWLVGFAPRGDGTAAVIQNAFVFSANLLDPPALDVPGQGAASADGPGVALPGGPGRRPPARD